MRPRIGTIVAVAAAAFLALSGTGAATWEIDSSHSGASFAVRHLMISNVRGEMHGVNGTVEWDEKTPESIKIDATVDVKTIDTGQEKRDGHLKTADFFDVEKFPTMTFKSKSATSAGPNRYKVVGDLTLHGVTKPVTLDVETTPVIKDPRGNSKFGVVATTKLDRTDFGLNWNKALETGGVLVGSQVDVTIDAELEKKQPPEEKAAEKK